jgi:streptogramin lyase
MIVSPRSARLNRVLPLLLVGVIPGCTDGGDGTSSASETRGTDPTAGTTAGTLGTTGTTGGATQGETMTPTTAGSVSESATQGTTEVGSSTTAASSTSTTAGTTTSGTTGPVDPSDSGTASSGDGTTTGMKLDMGPKPCDPDQTPSTFDYIWIANSSEGTVSKINTKSGIEEARYRTAATAANPSRTSVNQYGDVAVSNRDPGSITKISALKVRCVDNNNNGKIETSTGPGDILPWGQDECVLWHQSFPSPGYSYGPRPTAWEGVAQDPVTCETPVPRLWGGWMDGGNTAHFIRLDGDTGMVLDEVLRPNWVGSGYGPYGGAVNTEGDLFAVGLENTLIHIDAETLVLEDLPTPGDLSSYGFALDKNGDLWVGSYGVNSMYHYKVAEKKWYPLGPGGGWVLGLQTDKLGRVWGAGTGPCRLVHASVQDVKYVNAAIPLPGCNQPWGASIDNEGFVWIVDKGNKAFKVNPDTYAVELVVNGLVNPYTYSDMTGQGLQLVLPQ